MYVDVTPIPESNDGDFKASSADTDIAAARRTLQGSGG
jgi:hypothetical protein